MAEALGSEPKWAQVPMVPKRGYIRTYMERHIYREEVPVTHAPWTYHAASALTVLGTALLGHTWMPWGGHLLHPNLFTLIIGQSSIQAKSTAITLALKPLAQYKERLIGPNEMSAEGLLPELQEKPVLILPLPEFGRLLAIMSTWGGSIKPILMDLYDCPTKYVKKLVKKSIEVNEPKLSILGGVNTTLLEAHGDSVDDWRTGFLARFLPVLPGGPNGSDISIEYPIKRVIEPRRVRHDEIEMLYDQMVAVVNRAKPLDGFTDEAREVYREWVTFHDERGIGELVDYLDPIHNRITVTVLKIATILQADISGGNMLGADAMRSAIAFGEMAWNSALALSDTFAEGKNMQLRRRVLKLITDGEDKTMPGRRRRDILRKAHVLLSELEPILTTLEAEETITFVAHKVPGRRNKRKAWMLVEDFEKLPADHKARQVKT